MCLSLLLAACGSPEEDDTGNTFTRPGESLLLNAHWTRASTQLADSIGFAVQIGERELDDHSFDGGGPCFWSAHMDVERVFAVAQVNGTPPDERWSFQITEAPRISAECTVPNSRTIDAVTLYPLTTGMVVGETYGTDAMRVTFLVDGETFEADYLELRVTSYNSNNHTILGEFECLARNADQVDEVDILVVRHGSFLLHAPVP